MALSSNDRVVAGWRSAVAALACILAATACAVPMKTPAPPSRSDSAVAEVQLRAVLQDHWAYLQRMRPEYRIWSGERAMQLPEVSLDAAKERAAFARAALEALERIQIDALPQDHYITWLTVYWDMTALQRAPSLYPGDLSFAVPAASPLQTSLAILQRQPLADTSEATLFLRLVGEYAKLADSIRTGLAWHARRGVTLPRLLLPRVVAFTRSLIGGAAGSPLAAASERLTLADSVVAERFRRALTDSIARRVNPALERLVAYLEGDYVPRASERIGLGQYAGGQAGYRSLVRFYSTLEITPEDAHAAGLREVAYLDSLGAAARARSNLPETGPALRARLRADTAFAVPTTGTVLDRILAAYARVAATAGRAFTRSPESTADVQAMSATQEASGALATYVAPSVPDPFGHYRFNAQRWTERTTFTLAARVYQDLLPGVHLQSALQRENTALPAFRRVAHHHGYVEGWGGYAIELADSLVSAVDSGASHGASFGALLQRLSLACALVIDTGINYFGWSREQALSFLRTYLPDSDEELEREYIIPAVELPGSLVAAGLGAREFRGLRRWAERELGDRFDLRAFHDEVLSVGSVPLPVLGEQLEWWLWRERTKSKPDTGR